MSKETPAENSGGAIKIIAIRIASEEDTMEEMPVEELDWGLTTQRSPSWLLRNLAWTGSES